MSEFWIPAVRDPSSRDLQRETRSREDDKHLALLHLSVELTERSRSLDASVSIFLSPSVVTVVATVVVVFLIRVRVRRRRPMWNRARSTHWKIIASSSSSSSWLPVARCASNDEQKCNQSPRVPRGLIDGTRRVQILGRCRRDRSMRLLTGHASRIRLGTQFPRRTVRGEPIYRDARRPRPRPGENADADGRMTAIRNPGSLTFG